MKRVIMAEKRNAAEDICKAIGLKNITREGSSGFIHGKDEEGSEIVITWSNGHCLELPEPEDIDEKYKSWNLSDLPLPLNNDRDLQIKPEKRKIFYDIKNELKDADDIINAGDAGREGELIQRWIIELALKGKGVYPFRLWTQSLTEKAIKEAYGNDKLLGDEKEERITLNNLYDAGRARAIMDKYLGYNYSRLISLTQTDGVTVNYGRCKSPLVHAIVERDKEIENFVSVPFSYITVDLEKDGISFKGTLIDEERKRKEFLEDNKEEISKIISNLPNNLKVTEVIRKDKFITPPQPYDTLQIQKEMATKYDYEADKTLAIMEKLYDTYHILSYPRTEARHFTTELKDGLNEVLKSLAFGEFKPYVTEALQGFIPDKYFNNAKIADHHALCPDTSNGDIESVYNKLSQEEKNVYNAIVKNFIALYLPNYEYETMEIITEGANNKFLIKGKNDKSLGFKKMYANEKKEQDVDEDTSDQGLPNINEGDSLKVIESKVIDSKTKPKSHFTTPSLLDFMKVNNIGTGATRDTIIKELTERKGRNLDSAVKKEGKFFIATDFGRNMDSVIPDNLKSIEYLKSLENSIQDITDGKLDLNTFIKDMEADFNKNLQEMKANKSVKLAAENPNRKSIDGITCPCCGSPLNDVKWGYSCSTWKKDGSGCNFSIGKKQYSKTLSEKILKQLIQDKKTKDKLKKLKGKSGKEFEAYLALEIDNTGKTKVVPKFE